MNTQKVILFCAFFLIASYALSNYLVIQPEEPQTSNDQTFDIEASLENEPPEPDPEPELMSSTPITREETGHQYIILPENSWEEAEILAVEMGGHLVTINDWDEEVWLSEHFEAHRYWTGFNDLEEETNWVWSSGEPVTYTNWGGTMPYNYEGNARDRDVGIIYLESNGQESFWADAQISWDSVPGIIEISEDTESPEETGHIYRKTPKLTWQEAENLAIEWGGHLVTINDKDEENKLIEQFGSGNFWMGFNDINREGNWVWSSGEPVTYTNWEQGEPNDWAGGEDVGEIVLSENNLETYWNDASHTEEKEGIVEIPVEQERENDVGFQVVNSRVGSCFSYYTDDSNTDVSYELYLDTLLENVDVAEVESVTCILPNSSQVPLSLGSDNEFWLDIDVNEPLSGEFIYEATLKTGEKSWQVVYYDTWVNTAFDSVSPEYDEVIRSSEDLVFRWSFPLDENMPNSILVWDETGELYERRELYGTSHRYEGAALEDGVYWYLVEAQTFNHNFIHAKTRFEVNSDIN